MPVRNRTRHRRANPLNWDRLTCRERFVISQAHCPRDTMTPAQMREGYRLNRDAVIEWHVKRFPMSRPPAYWRWEKDLPRPLPATRDEQADYLRRHGLLTEGEQ